MLTRQDDGFIVPLVDCDVDDQLNAARQTLPFAYQQTGAIHVVRADVAVRENTVIGSKIIGYEPASTAIIDIDSLDDFTKAEHILSSTMELKEQ